MGFVLVSDTLRKAMTGVQNLHTDFFCPNSTQRAISHEVDDPDDIVKVVSGQVFGSLSQPIGLLSTIFVGDHTDFVIQLDSPTRPSFSTTVLPMVRTYLISRLLLDKVGCRRLIKLWNKSQFRSVLQGSHP